MKYRYHAHNRQYRNTVLKEIKDRTRGREIFVAFILAVLFFAPLILYVGIMAECSRLAHATDLMKTDILKLKEQNRKLLVERSELISLKRVETFASAKLSMTAPSPEAITLVRDKSEPISKNEGEKFGETSPQTTP